MRNSILVYLSFFYFQICCCQKSAEKESELHFILCSSKDLYTNAYIDRLDSDNKISQSNAFIYTLDADSLLLKDTINSIFNGNMKSLMHFDTENWFLLNEMEHLNFSNKSNHQNEPLEYFTIINYSKDSIKISKINISNLNLVTNIGVTLRYHLNNQIYQTILRKKPGIRNYYTLNLNGIIKEVTEPWNYQNYYVKCESGYFHRYFNTLNYPFGKDGNIKIGINNDDFENWKTYDIKLPKHKDDSKKFTSFKIQYTLPSSNYLIGYKQINIDSIRCQNIQYILNKSTNEWDSTILPNHYKTYNCHNDEYLYGTAIDTLYDSFANEDKIFKQIEINKNKYSAKYGPIPNTLATLGKFFIYHIPTKTFTEFVAKDRDTEVIQIIDDWIYYRVYDEIRKMKLDKVKHSFDLKTDELVVKDKDKVPHIHHIFMHKKSVVKKEELYKK